MEKNEALVIIDVQNDFCAGGALEVKDADRVVPLLNRYIELFSAKGLPVFASRDWHPQKTIHFKEYGGKWPRHCIQGTKGAEFHPELKLPSDTVVISAGSGPEEEGYSMFEGRDDAGNSAYDSLKQKGIEHVYIGGIATDYCVRASTIDALKSGFKVTLLTDAIKGVDLEPGDSEKAIDEMIGAGAKPATLDEIKRKKAA